MQVKNKLNGNITSVPTNDNGIRALIRLGVLEVVGHEKGDMVQAQNGRVFPVMDPPAAPKWIVTTMSVGGADAQRVPAIIFEIGSTVREFYTHDPADAKRAFGNRDVPKEILKQYAAACKAHYGK